MSSLQIFRNIFILRIVLDNNRPIKETKEKVIEYTREHKVDKNVIMTVAGAANCKLDYNALDGKGDVDMCTVFEETRMEGRAEGRIEGIIKMLKKYNESDETIINELIAELGGFEEIAKGYLDKYNHEMQKNDRNV